MNVFGHNLFNICENQVKHSRFAFEFVINRFPPTNIIFPLNREVTCRFYMVCPPLYVGRNKILLISRDI